jgi:hypothetical protein
MKMKNDEENKKAKLVLKAEYIMKQGMYPWQISE